MANEKRLIDANALEYTRVRIFHGMNEDGTLCVGGENAVVMSCAIKDAPTIDAVEVVHGRWIYHECVASHDGAISGYSCSECHSFVNEEMFDMDEFHKDFCGHCGAKMDGDGNETI